MKANFFILKLEVQFHAEVGVYVAAVERSVPVVVRGNVEYLVYEDGGGYLVSVQRLCQLQVDVGGKGHLVVVVQVGRAAYHVAQQRVGLVGLRVSVHGQFLVYPRHRGKVVDGRLVIREPGGLERGRYDEAQAGDLRIRHQVGRERGINIALGVIN